MKSKTVRIIISMVLIMGLATVPCFAAADNSELENSLKGVWGISYNNYNIAQRSTTPSGYTSSWFAVIMDMLTNHNIRLYENLHMNSYDSSVQKLFKVGDTLSYINTPHFGNYSITQNLLNGLSVLSYNQSYIAQQFYNDTNTNRSLLNQALHKIVDSGSSIDYTSILNLIKTNTDSLSGIKSDTSNLSGIKSDTSNLSGILSYTSNLPDIKSDTLSIITHLTAGLRFNFPYVWGGSRNSNNLTTVPSSSYPIVYRNASGYLDMYPWTGDNRNFANYLQGLLINTATVSNQLMRFQWHPDFYLKRDNQTLVYNPVALGDVFYFLENIGQNLGDLQYVLADSDSIQRKADNAAVTDSALDSFTSGGSASASISDFSGVADGLGAAKSGLSTNVSASSLFGVFNDENGFSWFSSEVQSSLNSTTDDTTNGRRLLLSSVDDSEKYPLYYNAYNTLYELAGGDIND